MLMNSLAFFKLKDLKTLHSRWLLKRNNHFMLKYKTTKLDNSSTPLYNSSEEMLVLTNEKQFDVEIFALGFP